MSFGLVCLTCRKYIGSGEWACVCPSPIVSENARTEDRELNAAVGRMLNGGTLAAAMAVARKYPPYVGEQITKLHTARSTQQEAHNG